MEVTEGKVREEEGFKMGRGVDHIGKTRASCCTSKVTHLQHIIPESVNRCHHEHCHLMQLENNSGDWSGSPEASLK